MIYLDYAATTPVAKEVLAKMLPYFSEKFGNPSAAHSFGQAAVMAADQAREQIARFLNCQISEIIFTSGATEANNLAISGLIESAKKNNIENPQIITSKIEHSSILAPCEKLEQMGIEIDYLEVDKKGLIKISELEKKIKNNTVLVSIMAANNETGIIQPIREVGKLIKKINEKKEKDWKNTSVKNRGARPNLIYFHTDATQILNFCLSSEQKNKLKIEKWQKSLNLDVKWNYLDLISFSGHKIYGPKGVGALYAGKDISLPPLILGGGQERNRRSGTLNVSGIVGLGAAIELLSQAKSQKINLKIKELRDFLAKEIQAAIPSSVLNTDLNKSIPNVLNISFLGQDAESLVIALDLAGIAISQGSACSSHDAVFSHVLKAMELSQARIKGAVRFSLGRATSKEEIKQTVKALAKIIK